MTRKFITPYLLIIVLLLSQWLAATVSACPLVSASKQSAAMPVMNMLQNDMPCHEMPSLSIAESNSASHQECCEQDCHCPTGFCFSVSLLNTTTYPPTKLSVLLVDHYQFSSLTTLVKLQQKPPQFI